jgi:hypothetical protein
MIQSAQEEALVEAFNLSLIVLLVMELSIFQVVLAPLGVAVEVQVVAWSTTTFKVSVLT